MLPRLWEHRDDPRVAALLGLPPPRKPGRPEGSYARDPLAYALATAVSDLHIAPVKLLEALGRDPSSGSRDHPWLNAHRKRGDDLRVAANSPDPKVSVLAFCRLYYEDDRPALLAKLIPYLVTASAGVGNAILNEPEKRAEAEAKLHAALAVLL